MAGRGSPAPLEIATLPLTLVGGVHGDQQGLARTLRFLSSFRPDLVLVELSPYGKTFRDRHRRTLQQTLNHNLATAAKNANLRFREALRHPQIKAIRRQLVLPFEYRAARRFVQLTGNPLILVDYSPFSRRMISHWPELLSSQNLSSLLAPAAGERPAPARTYELAARVLRQAPSSPATCPVGDPDTAEPLWEKRERYMAARIHSALKRFGRRKTVYLGGWQHLTVGGGYPSLRKLLGLEQSPVYLLDRGFL